MPTEQEELRLTVNLVDNASAGLVKLREELQQIGGGATAQATEKFKREQIELNRVVKQFSTELGDSFKAFGSMRSALGIGATAVGAFGAEMVRQMNALKDYSDKIRGIGIAAREIGINPGVLRNLIDQFNQVGISSDDVVSSMGGIQGKIAELQRSGSELWSKMVGEAGQVGSKAQASMNQFLQQLTSARSEAEQLNMIRQAGENIYQNRLRDTGNQQEAINARNQFWANLGYNSRLAELRQVKELTEAEKKRQDDLAKAAKDYADALDKTKSTWSDIVDISNKPMLENLKATLDYINPVLEKMRDFMEWWDLHDVKAPPGFSGLAEKGPEPLPQNQGPQGWLRRFGDWWSNAPKTEEERKKAVEDNTKAQQESRDAIRELNERIKQGWPTYQRQSFTGEGFGDGGGGLLQQATFRMPGGGAPMFGGGGGTWGGGGGPLAGGGGDGFGPGRASIPQREAYGGGGGGDTPNGQTAGPGNGAAGSTTPGNGEMGAAAALAFASQHLGEDEIRDQTKLSSFFREQGIKINPATTAWCAAFVNANLEKAGVKGTGSLAAGSFTNYGKGVTADQVQAGDVGVVRGRSPRTGIEGTHVGFLTGNRRMRNGVLELEMLGGNQGGTASGKGGVSTQWRTASSLHLRHPNYPNLPNGQTAGPGTGAGAGDTPAQADGASAGGTGGGAEYLRQQRAPLTKQLEDNPQLKKELAAVVSMEHEGDPTAVVESLYNRTTALNEMRAKKELPPVSLSHMLKGGFYGPVNKGKLAGAVAALERDPKRMAKLMGGIDAASTSNLLKGATDQGSGNDPNVSWPGGKIVRQGETYNDWGGGTGHEGNRQFRLRQQAAIAAAADRAQLDRSQVASTKVEGSGKISVDVNAPKGTKVDAQGGGLFKDVEVNRQTQMEPARRGPAKDAETLSI
ncbi:hypothetical protein [Bradyrhizobium neotropicale]|uniref:hypothetical protein n=1 Tax=Bradyrhizobium neotropicale TaxID=1497615 RepID=UPI001AD79622|nr:hypothetical protein [Bradyrhizobium neotropicale]MBO4221952.1 hypothetical protein [Bradyrhizobium neotropicale]